MKLSRIRGLMRVACAAIILGVVATACIPVPPPEDPAPSGGGGGGAPPPPPPPAPAALSISPSSIDFGTLVVGHPGITRKVTVTNVGGQTATWTDASVISGTTPDGLPFFRVDAPAPLAPGEIQCLPLRQLAPGASCVAGVRFNTIGETAQTFDGQGWAQADNTAKAFIALRGVAVDPATSLSISPTPIEFGTQASPLDHTAGPFRQEVTITNTGAADATWTGLFPVAFVSVSLPFPSGDGLDQFSFEDASSPGGVDQCLGLSGVLAEGASCVADVVFSPPGPEFLFLFLGTQAENSSPGVAGIVAHVESTSLSITPSPIEFGNSSAPLDHASGPFRQKVTITNTGTNAAAWTGPFPAGFFLTGGDSEFAVEDAASPGGADQCLALAGSLGVGDSCVADIVFSPAAAQVRFGGFAARAENSPPVGVPLNVNVT